MLGIIAHESERLTPRPRWYEFWKKDLGYEFCYIDKWDIEVLIVYASDASDVDFADYDVKGWVLTQNMRKSGYMHENIHTGDELMRMLSPEILQMTCGRGYRSSLAYIDEDLSGLCAEGLGQIGRDFKYFSIVTKNIARGHKIADEILDEYGLAVDVRPLTDGGFIQCDFAVMNKGDTPKLPREATVINAISGGDPRGRVIGRENLNLNIEASQDFPLKIENFDITEALLSIGLIKKVKIVDIL